MGKEPKQNSHLKTVSLIMIITLAGKVLGLVRDMMLGHNFATGMESTAFQVASRIPRTFLTRFLLRPSRPALFLSFQAAWRNMARRTPIVSLMGFLHGWDC